MKLQSVEAPKVESLHVLFKAKCLEKQLLNLARAKTANPDMLDRLSLRIAEQLKHINEVLPVERRESQLRHLQLACLRTNLDAIAAFEFKYPTKAKYTKFSVVLKEFIEKYKGNLSLQKYYGGMMPAPHNSNWLEKSRYILLTGILDYLLYAERNDFDDLLVILSPESELQYQCTYKVVDLLLMGECGGNFPDPQKTLVSSLFESYFADVWRLLINAVKIRPFGREIHTHYDALFYRYCRLLHKEDEKLTSAMVSNLLALENEAKDVETIVMDSDNTSLAKGVIDDDDDFFNIKGHVPNKLPRGPLARLIEAFTIMNAALKQCPLVITQRVLKQELRVVASQFGFLELVPYDEQQSAVIAMEEIKFQSEAIVRNSNTPYKAIHKSLVALVETETQWAGKLFDFLNGEDDVEGSLRKLMKQVGSKAVSEVQSAQLRTLEDFYLGLLHVLARLQTRLQACVNEHANQQHQVADLCDLFLQQDPATFDTYMVYLVVSAMFMDKFMFLVRDMLPKGARSQGFVYYEGNLARAFQHLFKLNEALAHIRKMVPNDEAHVDDIDRIEQLHARVQYFVQMANDMKCFLEMRPVEVPLADDELLKQMQEKPGLFQQRRLRAAFRATCNLWMHVWDAGELDIRRVIDEVAKTVDMPREDSYIPK